MHALNSLHILTYLILKIPCDVDTVITLTYRGGSWDRKLFQWSSIYKSQITVGWVEEVGDKEREKVS